MYSPPTDYIPCCVPYWDEKSFFTAGGLYSKDRGYYLPLDAYLDPFLEWLPRKWYPREGVPAMLPEMLPSNTWEMNLRYQLTEEEWGRLRRFCYQAAGLTCVACGSRGEPHVEAHEAWAFDQAQGIQKLKGLLCLCPTCHRAKHLGLARRYGQLPQVTQRLKWLNDWTDAQVQEAFKACEQRANLLSQRDWVLDTSFLRSYGVR